MDIELEHAWRKVVAELEENFGEGLDLQGILFLIGVQELGKGKLKLNKDQKLEVMHIAVCTLLSQFGFYDFNGWDEDGWPHWDRTNKLPYLNPSDQTRLMKQAIINYIQPDQALASE